MMPPSTLGSRHPRGRLRPGARSVETPPWTHPVTPGGAATQRICRDATWMVETPSLCHKLRPAAVSLASPRKPGRHRWNR